MAENVEERCTLVRAFADFEMLPDLLVRTSGTPALFGVGPSILSDEEAVLDRWQRALFEMDPNMDHAEPEDLPDDVSIERFLAQDALSLSRRLGLIVGAKLSMSAVGVLNIGKRFPDNRDDEDYEQVQDTLAEAIRDRYVGRDGLEVVPLVLEGRGAWPRPITSGRATSQACCWSSSRP